MRHQKHNVGLNRTASHRKALLANLASSLFTHKKIITTLPKARAARSYAEKLITFARKGDLASRRQVLRKIHDKVVIHELFDQIGPKFRERNGGYTRIIKLDNRVGDNAPMAILELVGFAADDTGSKKSRKSRKQKAQTEKSAVKSEAKPEKKVETQAEENVEVEEVKEETPATEAVAEESTPEEEKDKE